MARIRTIKPEFFTSEDMSGIPAEAALFAAGLLCHSDDEGYFYANPTLLKGLIFPLRECSLSTHELLTELSVIKFVRIGQTSDGKRWGQVIKFKDHQRVNRPTQSKIKTYDIKWDSLTEDSLNTHGAITEDSLRTHGGLTGERKGMEGKGTEEVPLIVDCSELITKIACAHPKSLLRNTQPREVPQAHLSAIIDAMSDERELQNIDEPTALKYLLTQTERVVKTVPRSEWKFLKDVSEFFRAHDYRIDPREFTREKTPDANAPWKPSPGRYRNAEAV